MADNITLNSGTGGATLAADDITSVWYQIVKLAFGALDTATLVTTSAGLPVDVVAALPAGTNAIGKLAANSGVDIGDVDVTTVVPGTGATNLGKAIDTAAGATDTGVAALVVRDDALGALTPAEGDFVALRVDANGALWTHDDALDAALGGSELQVDVVGALPAGANAIGKLAANSGVDIGDVDVTSISAGANLIGDVGLQPRTSGGLSFYKTIDLDESEEEIKGSAGQLYAICAMNLTAALLYLKLYNATAANVTVGTTAPDITIPIPGNGDSDGAGFVWSIPQGITFSTAITAAVTTLIADNDATAPAANACAATFLYK